VDRASRSPSVSPPHQDSSLSVAVGYPDLFAVFAAPPAPDRQRIGDHRHHHGVYLAISLITSALMNWYTAPSRVRTLMSVDAQSSYNRAAPWSNATAAGRAPRGAHARTAVRGPVQHRLTLGSIVIIVALRADREISVQRRIWTGSSRIDCLSETCGPRGLRLPWPFLKAKFAQFMYGFYPAEPNSDGSNVTTRSRILLVPPAHSDGASKGLNANLVFRRSFRSRLLPARRRCVRLAARGDAPLWRPSRHASYLFTGNHLLAALRHFARLGGSRHFPSGARSASFSSSSARRPC